MSKKARYIVLEGSEGLGKTTQTKRLVQYLTSKGFKVLETKEPGTAHLPVTLKLRELMLSNEFNGQITRTSRELISQVIRNIHMEKLVYPALDEYDFIIQDRGVLSGLSYGTACGNDLDSLIELNELSVYGVDNVREDVIPEDVFHLYDDVILFHGDLGGSLEKARQKQEFAAGDAMESQDDSFYNKVNASFQSLSSYVPRCHKIDVSGKNVDEVFDIMKESLNI